MIGRQRSPFGPDDDAPALRLRLGEARYLAQRMVRMVGRIGIEGPADGPPALVLPGFLTSDRSTHELRRNLGLAGWCTHGWGLGINPGGRVELAEKITERLAALAQPGRPVLLLGWSLGGLYAREIARVVPHHIRAVVTLGSPFSGDVRYNNNVRWLYEWIAGHPVDDPPIPLVADKPPVPTLALWSARDGIVSRRSASGVEGERDRAVEIDTTHVGFGVSRDAGPAITRAIDEFLRDYGVAP